MNKLWFALAFCLWLPPAQARPRVVAHRGGAALAPENTMAAFRKAVSLKVDAIELDIHPSKDDVLMVIHDDTLKRTFHHDGVVPEMTSVELQLLGVPTLASVLDLCRDKCQVIVEIKHPHQRRYDKVESLLVELLKQREASDNVIIISFDTTSLRKLHKLNPDLPTGYLFSKLMEPAEVKDSLGVQFLGPHYKLATSDWIQKAHESGLKVNPWTVNDPSDLDRLIQWGVDYITTDRPDLMQQRLDP